jgi:hypothetical protein
VGLAHRKEDGEDTQLIPQWQVFDKGSLVFDNVIIREARFPVLLLPPRETLLNREK